jgi:hypothetical protein
MTRSILTSILILGALAPRSQSAGLPGFSLQGESQHFSFYSRDSHKVDRAHVEEHVARVAKLLGYTFSGHADYYLCERAEDIAAATGRYAGGLTDAVQGVVLSTDGTQDHELVHLVAGKLGNPGAFFEEGLAVAVGDKGQWQGKSVDKIAKALTRGVALERLVASFDSIEPREGYAVAGSFVGWLIRKHGAEKVAEFFRAKDQLEAKAHFQSTFGVTLNDAGADWQRSL